jgi:tetratricopeptide (TPR) repeat protein
MMRPSFLSRFTPSLMAPEVLEEIFVQREDLAARLVRQVRESVLGEVKLQRLIVGPRGIGKTHLVSLVYHRVRAMDDLRDRIRIAWLREEEWGISSFLDLLLRILVALDVDDPRAGLRGRLETIYPLAGGAAEAAAVTLLGEVLAGRTLLLIVENLDEVFAGLGETGQQRFRAYLQNRRECTILATSPALFGAVWLETSPFYGFFQVTHLKEFDVEAARALLLNLARLTNKDELAQLLANPVGRNRLAALHHLVGGNPRLYVILAQFLTRESLNDLVDAFLSAVDELTPYYRERMQLLPPLQQKLVFLLSEAGAPVSVKVLAERSFATQQTVSSQLKQLRSDRFVVAHPVGRESWYELREPLLRLVLRVKKERGEPIRLFVEFLRVWYSRGELAERLATLSPLSTEASYIEQALATTDTGESAAERVVVEALKEAANAREWDRVLDINEQLLRLRNQLGDWLRQVRYLRFLSRFKEALETVEAAVLRFGDTPLLTAARAHVLTGVGRFREARTILEAIAHVEDESPELVAARASAWTDVHEPEHSLEDYRLLACINPDDPRAIVGQSTALMQLGRPSEGAALLSTMLHRFDNDVWFLIPLGYVLRAAGQLKEAEEVFLRVVDLNPEDPTGWLMLARVRLGSGDVAATVDALNQIGEPEGLIPSQVSEYSSIKGLALSGMGRHEDALQWYDRAVRSAGYWYQGAYMEVSVIRHLAKLGRWGDVIERLEHSLKQEDLPSSRTELIWATVLALASQQEQLWNEGVKALLARVDDGTDRVVFGSAVLSGVEVVLQTGSTVAARRWLDAWVDLSQRIPEIQVGYRLGDVAVRYRENPDERLLLGLPLEEREVVTSLLEIPEVEPT